MSFTRSAVAVSAALSALLAAGCSSNADGSSRSESRIVARFDRIHLDCPAILSVRRGARQTLTLRGEEDVLDGTEATLSDRTLTVDLHGEIDRLEVIITLPSLRGVEADSAADIDLVDVDSEMLDLRLDGPAALTASGRVTALNATLDGLGELQLRDLSARRATVRVKGVGTAEVNVEDQLEATVAGAGTIEYHGDPTVHSDVSGLGDVRQASR